MRSGVKRTCLGPCGIGMYFWGLAKMILISGHEKRGEKLLSAHGSKCPRAHPDLSQGPADLRSAALTTELCTLISYGRRRRTKSRLDAQRFFILARIRAREKIQPGEVNIAPLA